jgi:allantoate deiminase
MSTPPSSRSRTRHNEIATAATRCPRPCLGGETVRGGRTGGSKLEFASALAVGLEGVPGGAAISLDTDPNDGPTDAAGGIVGGGTERKIRKRGMDAIIGTQDDGERCVMKVAVATVMERCDLLANISEEPGLIHRPYGSRAMHRVNDIVAGWMRTAGMTTRRDQIGNLIGRYEGLGDRTFILGSHLDTVRDAGKYDGILGVMVAIACVQQLHDRDERLPYAIEVIGFADEEGLRFGTTYLGSSAYAGSFVRERLLLEDRNGETLREAVRSFGGNPDALEGDGRSDEDLLGYCEVHIEQGPVLEKEDLPVGVVTTINGQSRIQVVFVGKAGHAGTMPMEVRRDALCAAAEFVLEVEAAAKAQADAVGTVGEIQALPGAANVVPGEAKLSLDLRHPNDDERERMRDRLEERAGEIAALRACENLWEARQETNAVPVDVELSAVLAQAVEEEGLRPHRLPSGAGHDAAQMAVLLPVAMLFVRCEEGISHNPAESVTREDVEVAIGVMQRFLRLIAEAHSTRM